MRERVASENETGRWLVVESEIALKKIHAISFTDSCWPTPTASDNNADPDRASYPLASLRALLDLPEPERFFVFATLDGGIVL